MFILAASLAMVAVANATEPLPSVDDLVRTGQKAPNEAAVVIGIADYFVLPDVPYADRDAQSFADFLVYTRGVPSAEVRRLGAGAAREKILSAITEAVGRVSDGGTVWIYFAGHGAASPETGERVLLGADAQPDVQMFVARSVSVSEIKAAARKPGTNVILMMDACFSGAGRGGGALMPGARFAVPRYETAKESSFLEWTAAGPNQVSVPLESARHGAFTYAALGALRGWADGELDDTRDGTVTAEEAQLFVDRALRTLDVRDQTPRLDATTPSTWVLARAVTERSPLGATRTVAVIATEKPPAIVQPAAIVAVPAPAKKPPPTLPVEPVAVAQPAPVVQPAAVVPIRHDGSSALRTRIKEARSDLSTALAAMPDPNLVYPGLGWRGVVIDMSTARDVIDWKIPCTLGVKRDHKRPVPCSKLEKYNDIHAIWPVEQGTMPFLEIGDIVTPDPHVDGAPRYIAVAPNAVRVMEFSGAYATPEGARLNRTTRDEVIAMYGPAHDDGYTLTWGYLGLSAAYHEGVVVRFTVFAPAGD